MLINYAVTNCRLEGIAGAHLGIAGPLTAIELHLTTFVPFFVFFPFLFSFVLALWGPLFGTPGLPLWGPQAQFLGSSDSPKVPGPLTQSRLS